METLMNNRNNAIADPPNNNLTIDSDSFRRKCQKRYRRRAKAPVKNSFNLKLWVKSCYDAAITSLFFAPALAILVAIAMGIALAFVDKQLADNGIDPPVALSTTVDSARSLLGTVASATIAFAGTAFSVSLLVLQLGSSQYSPRVVDTLFRDPFNRRVVALVVGTFTYCLVVMRSVDSEIGSNERLVVPNVSVAVALVLGILSVLFIVAFIDHSANSMDVSQVLQRVTRTTITVIERMWPEDDLEDWDCDCNDEKLLSMNGAGNNDSKKDQSSMEEQDDDASYNEENIDNPKTPKAKKGEETEAEARDDCYVVRFRTSGWIQEIDMEAIMRLVPEKGSIRLHTLAGRYAIPGTAVCSFYPKPTLKNSESACWARGVLNNYMGVDVEKEELHERLLDQLDGCVSDAIMIGDSRTIRSDPAYGLRQLVDVVLRALSPGVNDPTTAQDGIFHIAAVVTEFLMRQPPPSVMETDKGGKLILNEQYDYDSIVRLGFDEARICAASAPMVALYLLESLRLIRESLTACGRPARAPEIERQARLIEACILNASHIEDDYEYVQKAKSLRFDPKGDAAA